MRLVLNEKKFLDRALKQGVVGKKPTVTLIILAKHYLSIGQNKKQVFSSIDNFMSKNHKGYVLTRWQKHINKVINNVYKRKNYDLLQIDSVNVCKNELDVVASINNPDLERLAFVLLVYAKIFNKMFGKERNWVNASIKEIAEDTRLGISDVDCALMIHDLYNAGLVRPSKVVDSTDVKVLFADSQGDIEIEITDFDNIVLYYRKHIGDSIGNCEVCGNLIELTSSTKKYCEDCRKEKQLQWDRDYQRKKYYSNVLE